MNQLEVSTQDSAALRTKYGEVMTENQRLEQDNQNLRRQQEVMISENGNSDSLYLLSRRNNDRDECEAVRKRYDDLLASHSQAIAKLERVQDEINSLNKRCEELNQERNTVVGFLVCYRVYFLFNIGVLVARKCKFQTTNGDFV